MIVTLGDSVCWGQGLIEEHKFDYLFAQARGLQFARVAHFGGGDRNIQRYLERGRTW